MAPLARWWCPALVCAVYASQLSLSTQVEVEAPAGLFRGVEENLEDGRAVHRFLGIPYAEPPTGNNRFRKPVPKSKLTEPYDASFTRPACLHTVFDGTFLLGKPAKHSEDCLYLNVYVPTGKADESAGHAVMVWIHGGAFVFGSSDLYASDTLSAAGNVIVVTLNYRLSIWGFLSFATDDCPGNFGLWDQHLAIRWVHENIRAFGGDPNRVTLFGESAGSASVIYQSMYPPNKGLFQRAIGQSGSIFASWAITKYPDTLDLAQLYSKSIGCATVAVTETIACLRSKTSEETTRALQDLLDSGHTGPILRLRPSVDGDFIKGDPRDFMHAKPDAVGDAFKFSFPLDLMTGITDSEGYIILSLIVMEPDPEHLEMSRQKFENTVVPDVLQLFTGEGVPEVLKRVAASMYTDWDQPDDSELLRETYVDMLAHTEFVVPGLLTASMHADTGENRTYFYHFTASPRKHVFPVPSWSSGAYHFDDVPFVFGYDPGMMKQYPAYNGDHSVDQWEIELSSCVMKLWSNFAKSGNPNIPVAVENCIGGTWPAFDWKQQKYLQISRQMNSSSVQQRMYGREYNFWRELVPALLQASRHTPWESRAPEKDVCHKDGTCSP